MEYMVILPKLFSSGEQLSKILAGRTPYLIDWCLIRYLVLLKGVVGDSML